MQGTSGTQLSKGKKAKKGVDTAAPAGASTVSSGVKLENVRHCQLLQHKHSCICIHAIHLALPRISVQGTSHVHKHLYIRSQHDLRIACAACTVALSLTRLLPLELNVQSCLSAVL